MLYFVFQCSDIVSIVSVLGRCWLVVMKGIQPVEIPVPSVHSRGSLLEREGRESVDRLAFPIHLVNGR